MSWACASADASIEPSGAGRWRKMKGETTIAFESGNTRRAEVHWYEAHGIGRREYKIKRYLD